MTESRPDPLVLIRGSHTFLSHPFPLNQTHSPILLPLLLRLLFFLQLPPFDREGLDPRQCNLFILCYSQEKRTPLNPPPQKPL